MGSQFRKTIGFIRFTRMLLVNWEVMDAKFLGKCKGNYIYWRSQNNMVDSELVISNGYPWYFNQFKSVVHTSAAARRTFHDNTTLLDEQCCWMKGILPVDINLPVVSCYPIIPGLGYGRKVHNTFATFDSFQSCLVIGQIHFDERKGPLMREGVAWIWRIFVDTYDDEVLSQGSPHHALSYATTTTCDRNSHNRRWRLSPSQRPKIKRLFAYLRKVMNGILRLPDLLGMLDFGRVAQWDKGRIKHAVIITMSAVDTRCSHMPR